MTTEHDDGFGPPIEYNTEGMSADDLHKGGGLTNAGWYHAIVESVSPSDDEPKQAILKLSVLAGCNMDGVAFENLSGAYTHRVSLQAGDYDSESKSWDNIRPLDPTNERDKRTLDGHLALALATGVISEAQIGKKIPPIHWPSMDGKQLVFKLSERTNQSTNKTYLRAWDSDFFPLGHEKVAHVPVDAEFAAGAAAEAAAAGGPAVDL